ncbi:MAG: DHH family phosphoesterase, partial [Oscillospiraceae bacterium]
MKINFQEAAALLRKSDDILILCHRNPDGDTLGSGFGLYYALKQMGKQARVICNDPLPPKMRFFQSETVFEEFSPHFVMSVDIADEQLFGDMLAPFIGKVQLAIDHHPSNSMFAERTLLDANAAATCEIIYKLLKELSVTPDKQIADCLYTGIATDTGCFKFSNVTPETHRIAADLIEYGCDFQSINKRIFETKSLGLMELEKHVLNTLEFHSHNRIGIITVTRQMLLESGINEAELDGLSGIPRKVEGVEVGVTIKE